MTKLRGNGSGKLSISEKSFVVRRLAIFDSPKAIAQALKDEHGADISPQGVEGYDPTKSAGRRLSERWRIKFQETRERFLEQMDEIPESRLAVRVKMLSRAAQDYESSGNYLAMAKMLQGISKDLSTFRRVSTIRGATIPEGTDFSHLSDDELDAELRRLGIDPKTVGAAKAQREI